MGFRAIVIHTIRMTTRRLAALVTIVSILLGSVFIFSFVEGDNTRIGLLRVLMTWSFTFTSGLLMLLVLYFASTVLDAEMVGRQIYLLDVKPIARWKVLAGKWTGLVIVMGCLLLVMGGLTYGALRWLSHRPVALGAGSRESTDDAEAGGLEPVRERLFTSRRSSRPRLTHADALADELARDLQQQGRIDAETAAAPAFRASLRTLLERRVPPITFGASRELDFAGLPPPTERGPDLYVRCKLYGRRGREPALRLRHEWSLAAGPNAEPFRRTLTSTAGVATEFRASASAIGEDGTLHVRLTNLTGTPADDPAAELIVPTVDGIELLVPTGSFEMNFVRGLSLLWIRLSMLAAFGIAANTFLRGPVTAFFLVGLILTGSLSSFVYSIAVPETARLEVLDALPSGGHDDDQSHDHDHDHARVEKKGWAGRLIDAWTKTVLPVILRVLPDFAETDPVPDLLVGREIGWGRLTRQAFYDVGVRAGLIWAVGLYCFRRKEVGLPVAD